MHATELTNNEPLSKDLRDRASRWMAGIAIGLTTYLGLMTLTTAFHVTADLAGWLLVTLSIGSALSALVISGGVILAMRNLQRTRAGDQHNKPPIHRRDA